MAKQNTKDSSEKKAKKSKAVKKNKGPVAVVGIGASAGGLEGVYRRWDAAGITTGTSTNDLICTGYR